MRILFLEPFHGGSHREFVTGLQEYSRHAIDVETLPARLWKWRLRTAGLTLAQRVSNPERFNLVVATGLLDLAQVRAVWGARTPPLLLYLHESQISYPVPTGRSANVEFLWKDVINVLTADHVVFNSEFHRRTFRSQLPSVIDQLPDTDDRPVVPLSRIDRNSSVLYPGCRFDDVKPEVSPNDLPTVIWNHRWEFDKNPKEFVNALVQVASRGVQFKVALLGERLIPEPEALVHARAELGDRIIYDGFPPRSVYLRYLAGGSLVVSSAVQENFGIAVMEAMYAGCMPLLPRRLVYPEIIPSDLHKRCLYDSPDDLVDRLSQELQMSQIEKDRWKKIAEPHAWSRVIDNYDSLFEAIAFA